MATILDNIAAPIFGRKIECPSGWFMLDYIVGTLSTKGVARAAI